MIAVIAVLACAKVARAQDPSPAPSPPSASPASPQGLHLESDLEEPPTTTLPEAPLEAPPPPPRHKGLVAEGGLGALGFAGDFRHVAPAGPWYHAQVGYEFLRWLMLFGEGEMAFTGTGVAEGPSSSIAFPIFGFGGGVRLTVHPTARVALFAQGGAGAMKADVPQGSLRNLGYKNAESLAPSFGGRIGLEWYQTDRHLALGLAVGARDASGFAKTAGGDTGWMGDASASIRYTF